MKKIGRGWQHTVYDLGNGRVFKKYNSRFSAYVIMLRDCFPYIQNPIWKFGDYYTHCRSHAHNSLEKLQTLSLPQEIFGNPKFLENGLDYEQDKMIPVHVFLKKASFEESKKIIDNFVAFNLFLVKNNVVDKSFRISKNFSFHNGNLVLSDLGELYFNEKNIKELVQKRPWAQRYVLGFSPNKKLKEYFIESMDSNFLIQ